MASSSDTPSSSKISLLSRDTSSSTFASSSKGKKKSPKDYLARLRADLGGKSPSTASSTSASSEGAPSGPSSPSTASISGPLTSKPAATYKTSLAPERDWDKAFGELASSYGFASTPIPGGRPVAPSKKFKARTAPAPAPVEAPKADGAEGDEAASGGEVVEEQSEASK